METVSAVIPTRNRPDLVLRAVRSALGQTYGSMEVVVVVDGPDEATVEALNALGDARVRVIALADSVGGSETRNIGAREGSGKWIAFLDDDDEWLPEKIDRQVQVAKQVQGDVVLGCKFIERTENGDRILPLRGPGADEPMSDFLYCPLSFSLGEGFVQTSTLFVSKSLLCSVPFVTGLKCGQETTWLLRAARHAGIRLHILPEVLAIFHDDQSRTRLSAKPAWRSLHGWARQNREYFTRKSYSFFIATSCTTYARKCNEKPTVFLKLLGECLFAGTPTPKCLMLFACRALLPQNIRRRTGSLLRSKLPAREGTSWA